jgi:hypothetical protein
VKKDPFPANARGSIGRITLSSSTTVENCFEKDFLKTQFLAIIGKSAKSFPSAPGRTLAGQWEVLLRLAEEEK